MPQENTDVTIPETVDPVEGQSTEGTADVNAIETQPAQPSEPTPVEDNPLTIPSKFVGKSAEDILKAYNEAEKELGRLKNDLGETKRKLEEVAPKSVETKPVQQPVASQPVKSLEELYQEEAQINPVQATINYQIRKENQQRVAATYETQRTFYNDAMAGKLKGYEDFKELEPTMQTLAEAFDGIISPEALVSPIVMQALHLMARGYTMTDKLKEASTQGARKASQDVKEKSKAFMEGSSTSSDDSVDFNKLTQEEKRKLLGYVDRSGE